MTDPQIAAWLDQEDAEVPRLRRSYTTSEACQHDRRHLMSRRVLIDRR